MNLPSDFVLPNYQNNTIANVPATVSRWLDVPFDGLPPLRTECWEPVLGDVKHVVVILLDALGWNVIERLRGEVGMIDSAEISQKITSVFPSTTVNALSTVWTGHSPAQHGLLAYTLFLGEYWSVGEMISLSPAPHKYPAALTKIGLKPEEFLHAPGFGEQLSNSGISSHAWKGHRIVDSALSKMHGRGLTGNHGAISFADALTQVRQRLENEPNTPSFTNLYWPTIDTISHVHGPMSESNLNEARTLLMQIDAFLLQQLAPEARDGVLVCLMADHGQIRFDRDQIIWGKEHPKLDEMLVMPPTGEVRVNYLHARQGKVQDVLDYFAHELADLAVAMPAETALDMQLFGSPPFPDHTRRRIGDVVVIMKDHATLVPPFAEPMINKFVGVHAGVNSAEMEVPWLVWRLDK